ncbi:MAG: pabB, partial [Firmicutes bacterium]|nr:pabB [Bacillota bacterium]
MQNKTFSTKLTAFDLFVSLRSRRHPFILDSGMDPEKLGRYSFVGADPFLTFSSKDDQCRIDQADGTEELHTEDPFTLLKRLLQQYTVRPREGLPFAGGAVGYFGYDLCHFIEKLPRKAVDDVSVPDCFFGFYDGIFVFDHQKNTVDIVALGLAGPVEETLHRLELQLSAAAEQPPAIIPFHNSAPADLHTNMTKEEYVQAIQRVREYIRSGDIYQANYTQRFDCGFAGDPVAFFAALRSKNPAPFAAYIDTGECIVVSSSPERFLRIHNGVIETRPIKGTISRGITAAEDEQNMQTLLQSEKDRAELLMIVDLERNDLSRIAKTGTVEVPELFVIETYATVHHLV